MLNLKNNENDAVFDDICKKKAMIKIKFQKMKGFLDSPLVEKSPNATDINLFCVKNKINSFFLSTLSVTQRHRVYIWRQSQN